MIPIHVNGDSVELAAEAGAGYADTRLHIELSEVSRADQQLSVGSYVGVREVVER